MSLLNQTTKMIDFLKQYNASDEIIDAANKLAKIAGKQESVAPDIYFVKKKDSDKEYVVTVCPTCGHQCKDDSTFDSFKNRVYCEKCGQKFD